MRQERSCGPKILLRQHFTKQTSQPMSSAAVSGRRRVPEWLNSFLAVQGELPAPTGYLTPSTVSLDQLPDVGIQAIGGAASLSGSLGPGCAP